MAELSLEATENCCEAKEFERIKGIALVMILVLSLIAPAIISALLYLVIQGTKFSGFHKRYASALDAGFGGTEISAALITNRGELVIPGLVNLPTSCICGFDTNPFDEIYPDPSPNNCLCRKLCIPPYNIDNSYNYECTTFTGPSTPYLYRIEINSQDANNPVERAPLSVLYAY